MSFQCPKCKSWKTDVRGDDGVCYNCHTFFEMSGWKVNWRAVQETLILFLILAIVYYIIKLIGVLTNA